MKQFIKFFALVSIAFLFLTTGTAFAEKVTFVKEYNYNASDLDSKVTSRTIALEQVKRLLLEELGTYLISETEVKNFRLTKDQITTYSAGVVSAEVVDEKWDGKTYYLKAKVSADPAEVIKSINILREDKQKIKELENAKKRADDALREIDKLKKELAVVKTDIKKQATYAKEVNKLSADYWFEKGYVLIISRKYGDALEAYSKGIELNPNDAFGYYGRGLAYVNSDQNGKAIEDFTKAIDMNPNYGDAYTARGIAYITFGQHDRAIQDFNRAIKLYPTGDIAYSGRGLSYERMGLHDKAMKDYDMAIEINPSGFAAYTGRGFIYAIKGYYDKAIQNYNKSIELNPSDFIAYSYRGNAYLNKGQYDKAIQNYNKTIELNPIDAFAYTSRGFAYGYKGQHDKAIQDFNKAIEISPNFVDAYTGRGFAYGYKGQHDKAIQDIKKAAALGGEVAQKFLESKGVSYYTDKSVKQKKGDKLESKGDMSVLSDSQGTSSYRLTLTDSATGLIWASNANIIGQRLSWEQAKSVIDDLNEKEFAGYKDWRLPTKDELRGLSMSGKIKTYSFVNVQDIYWSSTESLGYRDTAASVDVTSGYVWSAYKKNKAFIWPVRSGK